MASSFTGMPYFLEDKSGEMTDSSFTDIHARMSFSLRCTMRTEDRAAYMIYDTGAGQRAGRLMVPVACLDFGAGGNANALGSIRIGQGAYVQMDRWLSRVRKCVC